MEENFKGMIILGLIIIALFAGGLYYIFKENQNRTLTLNYAQQYMNETDEDKRAELKAEIERRIKRRPIAMTSRASFESFDQLMENAQGCDRVAQREQFLDPLNQTRSYMSIWLDCMDHPEQIQQR